MEILHIPVLLIAYNRPDTTRKVFDKIRAVKPKKLYVVVDGPRENKKGEKELCDEVKKIVTTIDWPCERFFLFNETNLGAEITVSSAVSWVLNTEEFVIVLEDDIVVPSSFFYFQQAMLLKYRNEPKIAMVSGCNFTPVVLPGNKDYLFSMYGHTWGWGTWRRAWEKFDLYINDFDKHLEPEFLSKISLSKGESEYFKKLFNWMKKKGAGANNWDFCWHYICVTNGWLSIIPRENLTSNIGVYGLHSYGKTDLHFRKFDEKFKVIKHAGNIQRNIAYDKSHFKQTINKRSAIYLRIFRKIARTIEKVVNQS